MADIIYRQVIPPSNVDRPHTNRDTPDVAPWQVTCATENGEITWKPYEGGWRSSNGHIFDKNGLWWGRNLNVTPEYAMGWERYPNQLKRLMEAILFHQDKK